MAEKVEIVGGDLDGAVLQNAASEATLLRLVAVMEKMGGGGAAGASAAAKAQQLAAVTQQQNTAEVKKGTEQTKRSSDAVGKFSQSVQGATASLANFAKSAFTGTVQALGGLTSELLMGGDKFSDFTKHLSGVPIVGGAFNALAGFLDKNIETYRSLSQVGATFGNDIFEMRKAAAEAAMPLEQFGAMVQQNANLLAVFGESSSDGAKRFGEVSKNLRTGKLGQQLMGMGFTMADVNESLLSYMDIQSRNGRLESMSTEQLTQEAGEYALEMDRLSRLTGIQRKELEKAVQANQTDARMRAMRSKLEGDALKNFDASMALVDKQLPGLSGALKDLADGVANTEEGQKLLAIGGTEFADLMTKAGKGLLSPEELQNGLAKLGPRLQEYANSIGEAGLQQLEKTQPALYAVLSNAHELNRLTQKNNQTLTDEQKARENVTSFLGNFEQAIAKIRGEIEKSLLNSAVFQRLKKLFGDFSEKGGGMLESLSNRLPPLIDSFLTKVEKYIKMFSDPNISIKETLGTILGDALGELTGVLASMFTTLFTNPKVILALVAAIGVMGAISGAKAAVANRVAGALGGGAAKAATTLAPTGEGAGKAAGAGIGGALKGIGTGLASLANPAALVGLGALTLAINGVALALRVAAPALEPFGAMVKKVFEGFKPVLDGVGEIIKSFGNAFKSVLEGFKPVLDGVGTVILAFGDTVKSLFSGIGTVIGSFSDVINGFAETFKSVFGGLRSFTEGFATVFNSIFEGIGRVIETIGGAISTTITSISNGIANIIGKINEYRNAGINTTTDQITRLSSIPSDNMQKTAQGITAMKSALDGFSPGLMSGISSSLGSMFAPDQAEKITKLAEAGSKLQPIGGYMNAVADGLKTFETVKFESIDIGTAKLRALSQQVNATADSFKRIEGTAFDKISEKISSVTASLKEVGASVTSSVASALGINQGKGSEKKTQEQLLTDLGTKLDRLNMLTAQVVEIQSTTADASKKTAKYTRQATGNML